ncbi:MAG: hypothetical protein JSS16_05080 [Proteobacteria bacterium]|uniref:hypothetical protein n=1 Tax=Rudaea sp. TaxID=2136325 RepID=UPI001D81C872|nr:hypothetical protein [Pseudomonadota bacterium]MBS0566652.1 hypothetical protein [Pseudomonadota bacterium]
MKTRLLSIAIALVAAASVAQADPQSSLSSVVVHSERSSAKAPRSGHTLDCTPPNSMAECAAFHNEIRRNFNGREIGMLFGAATAYPEYRSSYDNVVRRYDAFARAYDEQHLTAFASTK